MNRSLLIMAFFCWVTPGNSQAIKHLLPDTTGNINAQFERQNLAHCTYVGKSIGLNDLRNGTDNLEIRVWFDYSLDYSEELIILKWTDSAVKISNHKIFTNHLNYEKPFVYRVLSKSVLVPLDSLKDVDFSEIWKIPSESELDTLKHKILDDGIDYAIEIADKKQYKFLFYHSPEQKFDYIPLKEIERFVHYHTVVRDLVKRFKATAR